MSYDQTTPHEREPGEDDVPAGENPEQRRDPWRTIDPRWLRETPPPRRWLLKRPTKNDYPCPPPHGDGLLPLGKVGLLVADGGVGKTHALVALAVSVITGHPWLGYYHIPHQARDGKVLLLLAEEDEEEIWRRLYTVSIAYELTEAEQAKVQSQLYAIPLIGKSVAILDNEGGESRFLIRTQKRLQRDAGTHGWSLVVMDPFSRFSPEESESNNSVATRTIQAAETLTEAPGEPTVIIAHHAPQVALSNGSVRARGVTAIKDAVRWEATLRLDGGDVWFRQSKSNYSVPMDPNKELRLIRERGGLLRAATSEEDDERAEALAAKKDASQAERDAKRAARIDALEEQILEALASPGVCPTSRIELRSLVRGGNTEKEEAISSLVANGRIIRPSSKGEPYRVAYPPGQIDIPETWDA